VAFDGRRVIAERLRKNRDGCELRELMQSAQPGCSGAGQVVTALAGVGILGVLPTVIGWA
jgi:hypothetical protein